MVTLQAIAVRSAVYDTRRLWRIVGRANFEVEDGRADALHSKVTGNVVEPFRARRGAWGGRGPGRIRL